MDDFDFDAELAFEEDMRDQWEKENAQSSKRLKADLPGAASENLGASGERRTVAAGSVAHVISSAAEAEAEDEDGTAVQEEGEDEVLITYFSADRAAFGEGAQTGRVVDEGVEAFFRIKRSTEFEEELEKTAMRDTVLSAGTSLLSRPFDDVLRAATSDLEQRRAQRGARRPERAAGTGPGNALWVDKYKPNRFMDLLSQEAINRSVLWWLKAWALAGTHDGKALYEEQQRKLRIEQQQQKEQAERGYGAQSGQGGRDGSSNQGDGSRGWRPWFRSNLRSGGRVVGRDLTTLSLGEVPVEADGRPVKKALLLAGPPGCGKSTLAVVAAKSAGYHPLEVNASDDRTARKMTRLIRMATNQATSFDSRPNCVILDEIDGADGADALAAISRLINPPKGTGKSPDARRSVPRPIICICNNMYASSLRAFKSQCHVLALNEVRKQALIDRLRKICKREKITVDRGVLGALADVGDGDVRSCLHTLQFLLRATGELTEETVLAAGGVGQKDLTQSLFDLWERTFHHFPRLGRKRKRNGDAWAIATTPSAQLRGDVLRCDDIDILIAGLHENYLHITYSDPQLDNTVQVTDWLSLNDRWDSARRGYQAWALRRYSQYVPLVFHANCASRDTRFPRLTFPTSSSQLKRILTLNEGQLSALLAALSPDLRSYYGGNALSVDVVPSLVGILGARVRVASPDLLSPAEKWHLQATIDAHITYGASYTEVVSEETGETHIVLDPPLHRIHNFRFETPAGRGSSTRSTPSERQFLRHQILTQLLRLSVNPRAGVLAVGGGPDPVAKRSGKGPSGVAAQKRDVSKKRQRVTMADFVERKAARQDSRESAARLGADSKTHFRTQFPVRFKFHEGFTNAVRRPLYVSDFL